MHKNKNTPAVYSPQLNNIWQEYQTLWQDQSLQAWALHPDKQRNVNREIQGPIFAILHAVKRTPSKINIQ